MKNRGKSRVSVKDTPAIIEKRREDLQREINKHKANIDRTVFEKTNLEKQDLKLAKSRYKNR